MSANQTPPTASDEQASSGFNLWGFASRIVDDVKKNADSLVSTIAETNWTKEFAEITETLKEDTHNLEHSVASIVHLEDGSRSGASHNPSSFSFTSLGQSLVTGTRDWFEEVKTTVDEEIQAARQDAKKSSRSRVATQSVDAATPYSRLQTEISSIQRNSSTYCDEPEDEADFAAYLATFDLAARQPDIDAVLRDNAFMAELYARIVPLIVEQDVFWQRYFYRLQKLLAQHEKRRDIVMRTHAADEDDIGWDDETPVAAPRARKDAASTSASRDFNSAEASPPGKDAPGLGAPVAAAVAAASHAADEAEAEAQALPPADVQQDVSQAVATSNAAASVPQDGPAPDSKPASGSGSEAGGGSGPPSRPRRERSAAVSGNTSSDWSVVSSPHLVSASATPSHADGDDAGPNNSEGPPRDSPTGSGPKQPLGTVASDVEVDDEDLELADEAPGDGGDEEIDEDWGEWD